MLILPWCGGSGVVGGARSRVDEQTSTMNPREPAGQLPKGPDLLRHLRERLDRAELGLTPSRFAWPSQKDMAELLTRRLPGDQSVSVRWFRYLEQLDEDHPWKQHIADAYVGLLRLSGPERLAFYATVGCMPDFAGRDDVTAADRLYLNWTCRDPSYLCNGRWDMCCRNLPFRRLVPDLGPGVNIQEYVLTHPRGRKIFQGLHDWAVPMLDQLRAAIVAARDDPALLRDLEQLVDDLTRGHPEVAEIWNDQPSISLMPNGDVRYLRPPDPHAPDGLGSPVPVQLYVTNPLGKPLGWRYMHVSLLDEIGPDLDPAALDEEIEAYRFWVRSLPPANAS